MRASAPNLTAEVSNTASCDTDCNSNVCGRCGSMGDRSCRCWMRRKAASRCPYPCERGRLASGSGGECHKYGARGDDVTDRDMASAYIHRASTPGRHSRRDERIHGARLCDPSQDRSTPLPPCNSTSRRKSPCAATKPARGIITSDGISGKMFSRKVKVATPRYPSLAMTAVIQSNMP
jgi:hypothetical protein